MYSRVCTIPLVFFNCRAYSNCAFQLLKLKEHSMQLMQQQYPDLLRQNFSGQLAYVLRTETPQQVMKAGGLQANSQEFWLSNTGSGDNRGSVCFSLLPEVTALFHNDARQKKGKALGAYIYAFPLWGDFLLPGGKWRQVISPGAFPLPPIWRAREVLGIGAEHTAPLVELIHLGPLVGKGELKPGSDLRLAAYLDASKSQLIKPRDLSLGDDFPQEFDIIDTEETAEFQRKVEQHYAALVKEKSKMPKTSGF